MHSSDEYLIRFCEYPEQKANHRRVKHRVCVETKPGKVHADLNSKVVTDIIYNANEIGIFNHHRRL